MNDIVFDIDENGNMHGLYTDSINLFEIGRVINVKKASNVEFNQKKQMWEVLSLDGEVLFEHQNREKAIEKEIEMFSPGGKYCEI